GPPPQRSFICQQTLGIDDDVAEQLAAQANALGDRDGERIPETGFVQAEVELTKAGVSLQIT
ncbi:MAG: hypothetical protein ACT4PG_10380, partial [Panacagrimonas sp.]